MIMISGSRRHEAQNNRGGTGWKKFVLVIMKLAFVQVFGNYIYNNQKVEEIKVMYK